MLFKKIMAVDGSRMMHKVYQRTINYLQSKGMVIDAYELLALTDGIQALKSISEQPDIDLLIWEIDLPGATAAEMLEQLTETDNKPTVVIIDNGSSLDDLDEVLKLGANAILHKPFNSEDLYEALADLT